MNTPIKTDRPLKFAINQNVIIFIISIIALGVSEYFSLETTFCFAMAICLIASVSIFFTVPAYTYRQYSDKIKGIK